MAAIIHPLLALLASLSRQELARQVTYLKTENRILRSKLPHRISLSNQERRTLVKHGRQLGARIKELISIVSYSSFRRWVRELEDAPSKRPARKDGKGGRPRVEESLSDAILRVRKETGWGYTKIVQAMRRLGHNVSRQTVKNVIVQAGLGPQPHDYPDTWTDFLKRHAATLWQCDFACKKKWTVKGLVDVYFLVFIHIGTRRVWISPCTEHPTGEWSAQQARNFLMHIQDEDVPCTHLCRDNDTKYVTAFDSVFEATGCKVKRTTPMSPNLQAHVERVIQTIKHEVLNAFCIVSDSHLNHLLRVTQDWYNFRRGHSARDHLPPIRDSDTPATIDLTKHKLICVEELGGHLKSYRSAA
ncbi:integrase core domain-containing protein [Aureliella helgolandensis]|uniref:Integrase core domain protein n=1 Tax=Aureliella helgolandensis TaxID=2527968 RepID=A0A518GBF2_9BACT|nr:integrase core domain-containing protein [Aureliella helgolandensis]QDV25925.1 Integrase core domain protein [Aureliella helgolandensis]